MKQKGWIFTGIGLLVTGLVMIVFTLSTVDFKVSKLSERGYEMKEYTVEQGQITNIDISLIEEYVEVKKSKDDKIHIQYYENYKKKYIIEKGERSLLMKRKAHFPFFQINILELFSDKYKVVIEIPENIQNQLEINSVSGKVSVQDLTLNSLTVSLVSGRITVTDIETNLANLKNVSGIISMKRLKAEDINARNVSGRIEGIIIGNKEEYDIKISKVSGSCNLSEQNNSKNHKSLYVKNVSGKIDIEFLK